MARHGENIYKRKDGRFEGRYVIGKRSDGRTKFGYVYGRQYAEVQRRLTLKKAERFQRSALDGGREQTVAEWVNLWLENDVACGVKTSTLLTYKGLFWNHLSPFLGGYYLSQVTPLLLCQLAESLRRKGLGPSTIRGALRLFASAMRAAQDEGMIRKNPCRKMKLPPVPPRDQRVLTAAEQERLCRSIQRKEDLPALMGLYTGMRLGEICALKWSDIDWERRTVTVRRTVQRVTRVREVSHGKTCLLVGTPKTARSQRVIPLPEMLMERLRASLRDGKTGEYIFSETAQAAEPRTIQRRFERLAKRFGIQGGAFPYAAAQLCDAAAGVRRSGKDGQRAAGTCVRQNDAGCLRPQPAGAAAARGRSAGGWPIGRHEASAPAAKPCFLWVSGPSHGFYFTTAGAAGTLRPPRDPREGRTPGGPFRKWSLKLFYCITRSSGGGLLTARSPSRAKARRAKLCLFFDSVVRDRRGVAE